MSTETKHDLTKEALRKFTGSEKFYHGYPGFRHTEGVEYVIEHGGAHWLIAAIASAQTLDAVKAEWMQIWKLTVGADRKALLVAEDGDGKELYRQEFSFTDFPLNEISIWVQRGEDAPYAMLPSEY
jgi:hypothetical protein